MTPAIPWGSARARGVLATTIIGSGMAMLDGTVVNVALPRIGTDLHASVADLQDAITRYIAAHNKASKPFVWTTSAKAIFNKLAKVPVSSV